MSSFLLDLRSTPSQRGASLKKGHADIALPKGRQVEVETAAQMQSRVVEPNIGQPISKGRQKEEKRNAGD